MSEIANILRHEMDAHGPISFARFMVIALYCPKIGYYERQSAVIGSAGDFYTSASISPVFGQLLAWQFAEWSGQLRPGPITWIEAGAHDGRLALTMLDWLGKNRPGLLERLTYWIIEPSSTRWHWQQQTLRPFGSKVQWAESFDHDGIEVTDSIHGIIFSNELIDAFPVHRLAWDATAKEWFEWGIAGVRGNIAVSTQGARIESSIHEQGRSSIDFVWVRLPRPAIDIEHELTVAGFEIPSALKEVLPDGFIIDIAPSAATWWSSAAKRLAQGKLLTIDYGGTVDELLKPERPGGTLRAYFQHHATSDVLVRPGEQDLTAHVNFTQLQRAGENASLRTEHLISQGAFLGDIVRAIVERPGTSANWNQQQLRDVQRLIHPEHLGHSFRVLVQSR
jgi:SAM-dependent MidA family methyltransferase